MTIRIFYLCPDEPKPTGGVKQLYRHVDILNEAGFEAYLVHNCKKFRCNWFQNKTRIAYPDHSYSKKIRNALEGLKTFKKFAYPEWWLAPETPLITDRDETLPFFSSQDILVFPEYNVEKLQMYLGKYPHVIFNQNSYYTFNSSPEITVEPFPCKTNGSPYHHKQLLGVMTVSEDNTEYLKLFCPDIIIYRIHNSFSKDIFSYSSRKKRQIAFMPRKSPSEARQVCRLLQERNRLHNWIFYPIEGKNEQQVAEIMQDSALFMSFSVSEGFALPPVEAMSCGCLVIGYHGQGAKEYLIPPYAFPIEQGNIIDFVKKVEEMALLFENSPKEISDLTLKSSKWIQTHYSPEREKNDIVSFWNKLINN